jgi:hypothetical protein
LPKLITEPLTKGTVGKPPTKPGKPAWPDFTKKFGKNVRKAGITAVPTVFIWNLANLNLKPIHVAILLQMLACWGKTGPHPFPKRRTMMEAIGCNKRTLDRAIGYMVRQGLIEK